MDIQCKNDEDMNIRLFKGVAITDGNQEINFVYDLLGGEFRSIDDPRYASQIEAGLILTDI